MQNEEMSICALCLAEMVSPGIPSSFRNATRLESPGLLAFAQGVADQRRQRDAGPRGTFRTLLYLADLAAPERLVHLRTPACLRTGRPGWGWSFQLTMSLFGHFDGFEVPTSVSRPFFKHA